MDIAKRAKLIYGNIFIGSFVKHSFGKRKGEPMKPREEHQAYKNTDTLIWRKDNHDAFSPSISITSQRGVAINVGGYVIVKPIEEWFALANPAPKPSKGCNICGKYDCKGQCLTPTYPLGKPSEGTLLQAIVKCKADIMTKHFCPVTDEDIADAIKQWMRQKLRKCYSWEEIYAALELEGKKND